MPKQQHLSPSDKRDVKQLKRQAASNGVWVQLEPSKQWVKFAERGSLYVLVDGQQLGNYQRRERKTEWQRLSPKPTKPLLAGEQKKMVQTKLFKSN